MKSYLDYKYKPLVLSLEDAYKKGFIEPKKNGNIMFNYKNVELTLSPKQQYNCVLPTFSDLNKALSSTSNSPPFEKGLTLRELFDIEFKKYRSLLEKISSQNKFNYPHYGSCVVDIFRNEMYIIAPEFWHRLGLVTSNSFLLTDKKKSLSWKDMRNRLENAVIGFAGASVGGNIIEGAAREMRFKTAKVADPDHIEITNLNRLERGNINFLVSKLGDKEDFKDPYEMIRLNKAEITAYTQQMVDPYSNWYVYSEGLNSNNIDRFLVGDDKKEPKIDVLVEEVDDISLKVELRKKCREYKIPVLMFSDFGNRVQGQFQDYFSNPDLNIGYNVSDEKIEKLLSKATSSGNRKDVFSFVEGLCGEDFAQGQFKLWVEGKGEQPTSSLPQSGSTAMASGAIGGKVLAMHFLGYDLPERFVYDLKNFSIEL